MQREKHIGPFSPWLGQAARQPTPASVHIDVHVSTVMSSAAGALGGFGGATEMGRSGLKTLTPCITMGASTRRWMRIALMMLVIVAIAMFFLEIKEDSCLYIYSCNWLDYTYFCHRYTYVVIIVLKKILGWLLMR